MVALEIIIALFLLVIAVILIRKDKFTIEINVNIHENSGPVRHSAAPAVSANQLDKLTDEERELYEDSYSLIGALNKIMQTGELPEPKVPKEELK